MYPLIIQIMPIIDKEIEDLLAKIEANSVEQSDVFRLMEIGRKHGFGNINNRKKIWPVLLQINIEKLQQSADFLDWRKNPDEHSPDYQQLKKDATRSFFTLSIYKDLDKHYLTKKQEDLLQILDAFAKNEPKYRYFQGFHDVVSIFIGIFGINIGYYMSHKVATTYLRDSFLYSFQDTVLVLNKLIYFITVRADPQFEEIFKEFEDQKVGFTMAWIITWFAHSFENIEIITRIWDYLISSPASAIVYISAALIIQTKSQLLEFLEGADSPTDIGTIHMFYQDLNERKIDIGKVISRAIQLEETTNIETLKESSYLPEKTVMKEQNFVKLLQSQEIFKQTKLRKKKSKKVMNTVLAVGAIVVLGALAFTKYGKKLPVSSKDIINNL